MSSDDDGRKSGERKPLGRVRHDAGGRAVWQWAVESGRHAIDSTSRLLKKLDISQLRLVDEEERLAAKRAAEEAGRNAGNGPSRERPALQDPAAEARRSFDPYDSRTPVGRGVGAPKPKAPPRPRITQPVRTKPAAKPGWLARLFGKGR